MLIKIFFVLLFIFQISYSYKSHSTQYICIESTNGISQTLPSCLPGYVIDIENVIYESTRDDTCSGIVLCQIENKNTFLFACNRKRTCQIDINNLRFHINSTCSSTIRFFVQYRCLPVIQEQKDYLCESSTLRRPSLGDINLSCIRNYRLHITMSLIGISLKQHDETTTIKTRFKCNKDTQTICNNYIPNNYRDVCDMQSKQECKITYNQRPELKDCQHGITSNFSLVEYSCIPDDDIKEDLPRIDICSKENSERIPHDRGLLHSPNYPQPLGQYLACTKELYIPRESRLRLFMLEKSLEYSHELNIYLLNQIQTLSQNELLDINITNHVVKFELKTNHVGGGQFLLYFQIDSRLSEYAPFSLESGRTTDGDYRRGKLAFNRYWGIIIGCILGLLLLMAIILLIILITKRRRARSIRYLKKDDDHRQQLNNPITSSDHHHDQKGLQVEQPYLASSSPTIFPSSGNNHNRPHSASSTTSSIIMHQMHDGLSDRETLIKPINQIQSRPDKDIDNLYEEIKEQQHQTALALGINGNKGDIINPYLEAKCFEQKKPSFQGQQSAQPIRDHHENEPRYQHPKSANKRPKKPSPKAPLQPSAPPLHLIEN